MPRRLKAAIVPACLVALLPAACTPQAPTFRAPVQDASARQHIPDAQWVRAIAWGDADMDDHRRFPVRAITNGGIRFDFRQPSPQSLQRYLPALAALPRATNGRQVTEALDEFLKRNDTIAFLVIKDDALIYEAYFNGYARDSTVTSFSIAKSVVSALVGFAIAEGRIGSVDDQITTYVPELSAGDPRYRYVTLRHLLTMTSGVRYREGGMSWSDDATKYYAPDLRAAAVSSPIAEEPGRAFRYNNFNPLLLGLVLERATGRPVARYLEEKIWKPLGMDAPGSRSLDSALSGSRKWRAASTTGHRLRQARALVPEPGPVERHGHRSGAMGRRVHRGRCQGSPRIMVPVLLVAERRRCRVPPLLCRRETRAVHLPGAGATAHVRAIRPHRPLPLLGGRVRDAGGTDTGGGRLARCGHHRAEAPDRVPGDRLVRPRG